MNLPIPPEEWFYKVNREFREKNVDVRQRPWLAFDLYCRDFRVMALAIGSEPANRIFEWFSANTKPGAHQIGPMFTAAFFYDACFWPVNIFIGFGTFQIDPLTAIQDMTPTVKTDLMASAPEAWRYMAFWADCLDYAYGMDDLHQTKTSPAFAYSLFSNADRELRASIALLLEHRPNPKAAMSCRMAVEIFLKAFLVIKANLDESGIKAFNHRLKDLFEKCKEVAPGHDLLMVESDILLFPEIHDRYTGTAIPHTTLWKIYAVTQCVATAVVRSFTSRDTRPQLFRTQNSPNPSFNSDPTGAGSFYVSWS